MIKTAEMCVTGNYFYNGNQIEGVRTTIYGDELLINAEKLTELLQKSARCDSLEKSQGHLMKLIQDGALAKRGSSDNSTNAEVESLKKELREARSEIADLKAKNEDFQTWYSEPDFTELRKRLTQKSIEVRQEKCRLAMAIALSFAIRGSSTREISAVLREKKLSDSAAFISKALSIKHEGDRERLRSIMLEYPDVFTGVEEADFERWFDERHQRAEQAEKKRQITKAVKEAMNAKI